jgi:hypothetical protein
MFCESSRPAMMAFVSIPRWFDSSMDWIIPIPLLQIYGCAAILYIFVNWLDGRIEHRRRRKKEVEMKKKVWEAMHKHSEQQRQRKGGLNT